MNVQPTVVLYWWVQLVLTNVMVVNRERIVSEWMQTAQEDVSIVRQAHMQVPLERTLMKYAKIASLERTLRTPAPPHALHVKKELIPKKKYSWLK